KRCRAPFLQTQGTVRGRTMACRRPPPAFGYCDTQGGLYERIQHMETTQTVKILGRFIVADPKVCHGQPTFRGTRVFVADVLDQVARGLDWETIIEEWHGSITHEAIAEAVHLAAQALLKHVDDFVVASTAS